MKRLCLVLIIPFALGACHPNHDNPVPKPVTGIAEMYISTPDSIVDLHFYYDSSYYVTKIMEYDTIHGQASIDSLAYTYDSTHSLTGAIGYIGMPLSNYILTYSFDEYHTMQDVYYYAPNDLSHPLEYNGILQTTEFKKLFFGRISFPNFFEIQTNNFYNNAGNVVIDTCRNSYAGDIVIAKTNQYETYDANPSYTSLLKGVVIPTIHNICFPFFAVNNCTAQTSTDFTGPAPVTVTYTTVYTYNSPELSNKSCSHQQHRAGPDYLVYL